MGVSFNIKPTQEKLSVNIDNYYGQLPPEPANVKETAKIGFHEYCEQSNKKTNSSFNCYINKSREAGENELRELALASEPEEAFLFFECKDKDGNIVPVWYEVGVNRNDRYSVDTGYCLLEDIKIHLQTLDLELVGTVTHYHFHPDDMAADINGKRKSRAPFGIMFSSADYLATLSFSERACIFGFETEDRIVGGQGIWRLTPNKNNRFCNDDFPHKFITPSNSILNEILNGLVECGKPSSFFANVPIIGVLFSATPNCTPEEAAESFSTHYVGLKYIQFP